MMWELFALVLGQNAAEARRNSSGSASFPDKHADALTGVAAAILGSFGLLIGLIATSIGLLREPGESIAAIAIIAFIGLGCSWSGSYFGHRAPHVTSRFLGLAKYAVVASVAGMILSVVSLLVAAARTFL